jgi:hypothetical protein
MIASASNGREVSGVALPAGPELLVLPPAQSAPVLLLLLKLQPLLQLRRQLPFSGPGWQARKLLLLLLG